MFGSIKDKLKGASGLVGDKVSSVSSQLGEKAFSTAELVGGKVISVKEEVGDKVSSVVGSAMAEVGSKKAAAVSYLEENWEPVEQVLVEGMISVAHEQLKNDDAFMTAINTAFELLPTPVRLIVPRNLVSDFGFSKRDLLLQKIEARQKGRTIKDAELPSDG